MNSRIDETKTWPVDCTCSPSRPRSPMFHPNNCGFGARIGSNFRAGERARKRRGRIGFGRMLHCRLIGVICLSQISADLLLSCVRIPVSYYVSCARARHNSSESGILCMLRTVAGCCTCASGFCMARRQSRSGDVVLRGGTFLRF